MIIIYCQICMWTINSYKPSITWPRRMGCNWTRTQNHLVRKRTLNNLAKWLSVCLRTKWFWVRVQLQSLKLQISCLLRARSSLTFSQLWSVDSLWNAYMTWQEHTVSQKNGDERSSMESWPLIGQTYLMQQLLPDYWLNAHAILE